jgi:hypothetical protein
VGADGILLDVPYGGPKMLGIQRTRKKPTLPKMPTLLRPTVKLHGIGGMRITETVG